MTVDSWDAWTLLAQRLLGWHSDRDLMQITEWTNLFARRGCGIGDMTDALERVALDPPEYKRETLGRLFGAMRAQTGGRYAGASPFEAQHGRCALCGGSGIVIVPHPARTPARWYTLAVTCRCGLGRAIEGKCQEYHDAKHSPPEKRNLTFDHYEARYGRDWGAILADRDEELRERRDTGARHSQNDALAAKLLASYRVRQ